MASASVYFNESPIVHCLASVGKAVTAWCMMIIIKIIILYFIEIRHTDDFPSAGISRVYRLVILAL